MSSYKQCVPKLKDESKFYRSTINYSRLCELYIILLYSKNKEKSMHWEKSVCVLMINWDIFQVALLYYYLFQLSITYFSGIYE